MSEPLRIEISLGEVKSLIEYDPSILHEDAQASLFEHLQRIPSIVNHMARKAGLRPREDARMAKVKAASDALAAGDRAMCDRIIEELYTAPSNT